MAITTNNVQNVKFLRNGSLYLSREAARTALEGNKTLGLDGSAILARYQEGTDPVKTLVGFIYNSGESYTVTIFDIDDAGADVERKIQELRDEINAKLGNGITSGNTATAQLTALSGTSSSSSAETSVWGAKKYADQKLSDAISALDYDDTAATGEYVSQVTEADGIIAVERVALPTVATITESGKPIIAVAEDKGTLSASAGTIDAQYVNITDTGGIITATNVEGALAEIAAEIDAMDLAVVSGSGEVITAISEDDGKVSAEKTAIKDVVLTGYVKDTTATGNIEATDDIEAALSKLENKAAAITIVNDDKSINVTTGTTGTNINVNIKSGEHVLAKDGDAGLYTNISLSSITPTSTTVKEEYQLTATDGTKLGDTIKIYKDSSIVEIYLGTSGDTVDATTGHITKLDGDKQYLNYVYFNADGQYEMTKINISVFITEQEFASGVTFDSTENKVKGVVDPTSENFLTVGADGFKLSGVQTAINSAIEALDATVGSQTVATGKHVAVEVVEADGVLSALTVTENDIASAQGLADEITARTAADTALSDRLGTGVTTANSATVQLAALSGTPESLSGDTSVEGAKRYADAILANSVADLDATVSGETGDGKVSVKVTEEDGVITAVDVVGTDIASASALTAEIEARKDVDGQTGQTYEANTGSSYINDASNLNDADVKLAAALKSLSDATVNEVQVNGVALSETSNAVNVQISGSTSAATASDNAAIVVNTDSSTGAITLGLNCIDCGTY